MGPPRATLSYGIHPLPALADPPPQPAAAPLRWPHAAAFAVGVAVALTVGAPAASRLRAVGPPSSARPLESVVLGRRSVLAGGLGVAGALALPPPPAALPRKDGVDRPQLHPPLPGVRVIDVAGMLSQSQVKEVERVIDQLDRLYGVKLRVLCQRYPESPGRAIERYWVPDDDTIVLVVDDTFPNLLNFNVGSNVDLLAPNGRFWTQLRAKYGTLAFVRKNGEDEAVLEAVEAILDGMTNPNELGRRIMLGL
jgi:hypothetical protein